MADAWEEHEAAVKDIMARCGKALQTPEPGGMTYVSFRAELTRLQTKTAAKLGKARADLMDRFGPEQARLKEMCGV